MSTTEVEDPTAEAEGTKKKKEKQRLALEVKIDKPSACERHVTVTIAQDDVAALPEGSVRRADAQGRAAAAFAPAAPRASWSRRAFKEHVADQVKGKLLMDSLTQMSRRPRVHGDQRARFRHRLGPDARRRADGV